jgi:hypothetical protein
VFASIIASWTAAAFLAREIHDSAAGGVQFPFDDPRRAEAVIVSGQLKQTENIGSYAPFDQKFFSSAKGYNGVAAGDALIAVICCQFEAPDELAVTSVIDSSRNKWTQVPGIAIGAGTGSFLDVWVAYDVAAVAASDGLKVAVKTNQPAGSPTSRQFNVALLEVQGLSGSAPSVNTFTGTLTYPFSVFVNAGGQSLGICAFTNSGDVVVTTASPWSMLRLAGDGSLNGENIAYTVGTGMFEATFNTEFGGDVDTALAILAFSLRG